MKHSASIEIRRVIGLARDGQVVCLTIIFFLQLKLHNRFSEVFGSGGSTLAIALRTNKGDVFNQAFLSCIKGNRVKNIVSILRKGPGSPERIITCPSDEGVESIRALAGNFKAPVRV